MISLGTKVADFTLMPRSVNGQIGLNASRLMANRRRKASSKAWSLGRTSS